MKSKVFLSTSLLTSALFSASCGLLPKEERVEIRTELPGVHALKNISQGNDITKDKARAVVRINYGGTASFISPDGKLLTNNHVLGQTQEDRGDCMREGCYVALDFNYEQGKKVEHKYIFAYPIAIFPKLDAAIYQIYTNYKKEEKFHPETWISMESATGEELIGKNITVIGHPLGLLKKFSTGKGISHSGYWANVDNFAFGGNSGSPMLNDKGQFVCLLHRGPQEAMNIVTPTKLTNYSICTPSQLIRDAVKEKLAVDWQPGEGFPDIGEDQRFLLTFPPAPTNKEEKEEIAEESSSVGSYKDSIESGFNSCQDALETLSKGDDAEIRSPSELFNKITPCLDIISDLQSHPKSDWVAHPFYKSLYEYVISNHDKFLETSQKLAELVYRYLGDLDKTSVGNSLRLLGGSTYILSLAVDHPTPYAQSRVAMDNFMAHHPFKIGLGHAASYIKYSDNKEHVVLDTNLMDYIRDYRKVSGYEVIMSSVISGFDELYVRGHYKRRYNDNSWNEFAKDVNRLLEDPYMSIIHKLCTEAMAYGHEHSFKDENVQELLMSY